MIFILLPVLGLENRSDVVKSPGSDLNSGSSVLNEVQLSNSLSMEEIDICYKSPSCRRWRHAPGLQVPLFAQEADSVLDQMWAHQLKTCL